MTNPRPFFDRVLVVGLGLLGGSFALALKEASLAGQILGRDANPDHEDQAMRLGLVSGLWSAQARPEAFDLIFLAVPPGQTESALADLLPWLKPGTLVTDAGSVKGPVAQTMQVVLGSHSGVVPAHPIAGWHTSGPGSGRGDLFRHKPVVLTPLATTAPASLAAATQMWIALGARVIEMEIRAHDSLFALISHLPHLLAFSTMGLALDARADLSLVGSGFLDATRLAQCPAPLWADIALTNREALLPVLEAFLREVQELQERLRRGDLENLKQRFDQAQHLRMALEARVGRESGRP